MPTKKIVSLVIVSVVVIVCLVAMRGWTNAFIKLDDMRIPYVVVFAVLLLSALWLVALRFELSVVKLVVTGVIVGQIAATAALLASNFFIPAGMDRNMASFERWGMFQMLALDSTVAFVLGGWLIGGLAFSSFGLLSRTRSWQR